MKQIIFYDMQEKPIKRIIENKKTIQDDFTYIGKDLIPAMYIWPIEMGEKLEQHWKEKCAIKQLDNENLSKMFKLGHEKIDWIKDFGIKK